MKVVTAAEMRRIDNETIRDYTISGEVLMERAGLAVAARVREASERKKIIVLAGGGNNGGDGLVAARNLHAWGFNVRVFLLHGRNRLGPECRAQLKRARQYGVPVEFRSSISGSDLHSATVIDAIFGTGINKPVTAPVAGIIAVVNKYPVTVVSVDIPSGISADSGQIMGEAVRADITVTFGLPKVGHLIHPGAGLAGSLFVEDIGFPPELLNSADILTETVERNHAASLLPERPSDSHKGHYGHVFVLAGSRGKTGAALLAARACLRAGAGMVTLGVPETIADIFQGRVTEEMVLPLPDTGRGNFSENAYDAIAAFLNEKADILAVGPGITTDPETGRLTKKLVASVTVPMVIDADGINNIAGRQDLLAGARAPVILTPHAGEMSRILSSGGSFGRRSPESMSSSANRKDRQLVGDRISTVRSFSKETGVYVVLKGSPTVIAEPQGRVFINTTGNPGMATAGSGDVLTGTIAALAGQGLNPLEASVLGVYLHGLSADKAASRTGMHSLIASDIIESLPETFLDLGRNA